MAQEQAVSTPTQDNKPHSIGGKIFDLLTYAGLAAVGTFFLTIPLANLFKEGGRFHAFDEWLYKSSRKIGIPEGGAEQIASTTRLMHGGNLMLIPVGIMEHFRTPIINGLNRMFRDPTNPESVKDSPPQTIGSLFKARAVAWLTVFGAFQGTSMLLGSQKYNALLDKAGTALCKLMKRPTQVLNAEGKLIHSKTYNFGHTGALDILATIASASLLYVTGHFFAKRREEKLHHQQDAAEPSPMRASYDNALPSTQVTAAEREPNRIAAAPELDAAQAARA